MSVPKMGANLYGGTHDNLKRNLWTCIMAMYGQSLSEGLGNSLEEAAPSARNPPSNKSGCSICTQASF